MEKTLNELSQILNATLVAVPGQEQTVVRAVGAIKTARPDQITFAGPDRAVSDLEASTAAAILVTEALSDLDKPQLVVKDVDTALIEALSLFAPPVHVPEPGIHPSAVVPRDVEIGPRVSVGPGVIIEPGVVIGADLTHLPELFEKPFMGSIGGAGIFDLVYLSGLISFCFSFPFIRKKRMNKADRQWKKVEREAHYAGRILNIEDNYDSIIAFYF